MIAWTALFSMTEASKKTCQCCMRYEQVWGKEFFWLSEPETYIYLNVTTIIF